MKVVEYSNKKEVEAVIRRPGIDYSTVFDQVRPIIEAVKEGKDSAVKEYTKRFDGIDLGDRPLKVSSKEISSACRRADPKLMKALTHAYRNIKRYHEKQHQSISKSFKAQVEPGISIEEKTAPLDCIGAYVPGGRASYPSTVFMAAVPAKVAGVKKVAVVSPPEISDQVLAACSICKVDEVYRVGGAQAIAALAYGTESIPKVDKVVGPGNKYVTSAKLMVFGQVAIDMPAGPSEVLIIGDSSTPAKYVAADILAQAEHDPDAQCVFVTDSGDKMTEVVKEMREQMTHLKRKTVLKKSLLNSYGILVRNMDQAAEFANQYAPEHLEVMTKNSSALAKKITKAGTVFLGNYSPVPAGDYASGSNHVLPTGGAARFSSGLSVRDFLRNYSVQSLDKKGLARIRDTVETLALSESLDAHAKAVAKRYE